MPKRQCTFNEQYKKEYPFIKKGRHNYEVECNVCHCFFSISHGGRSDIKDHIKTAKHENRIKASTSSKSLKTFFIKPDSKEDIQILSAEMTMAYHTAKHHQSFHSNDCTGQLFHKLFPDSEIAKKYSSARTKTTALVSVLGSYSCNVAVEELKSCSFYGIATDASNHKNKKMFPFVVQYFTKTGIQSKLLRFASLPNETSETISQYCIDTLTELNLPKDGCVAFCGDNANTNFGGLYRKGVNNVYARLCSELKNEHLEGVGCPAHIIHNTIQSAADRLSIDVELIVIKIFTYFSIYTVRNEKLKEFCDFVNVEYQVLLKHSKTRWLSLLPAVERILKLYEALKSFFLSEENPPKILEDFFNNPLSEIYLWFVHSQLSFFSNKILKIEGKVITVFEVYNILNQTLDQIKEKKECNFLTWNVKSLLKKLDMIEKTNRFENEIREFYSTCYNYLSKWIEPLKKYAVFGWMALNKVPEWDEVSETIQYLESLQIKIDETSLFTQITIVKKIITYELEKDITGWKGKKCDEKWTNIFSKIETEYEEQYDSIYKICEYVFCIPGHNVNVERIFSLMAIQWTDERNKLESETVEAILQIMVNYNYTCLEFYDFASENKKIQQLAKSSEKYKWYNKTL